MPRKPLIRNNEFYYHVTSRSNHKDWFSISLVEVWELVKTCLKNAYQKHPVEILQFVLMSNHYHLLIRTPNSNLDRFMYEFNKQLSLKLRIATQMINRMFGGRYKWSLIMNERNLLNVYRYIYQNPLRANIVKKCEDYPFSTLRVRLKNEPFPVPMAPVLLDFKVYEMLIWLNEKMVLEKEIQIKKGLRKNQFKEVFPRQY